MKPLPLEQIYEHALVINLAHRTDRLATFTASQHPFRTRRQPGLDGDDMHDSVIDRFARDHPRERDTLARALACASAHRSAIQYAADHHWPCVTVFEDDAELHPALDRILPEALTDLHTATGGHWAMLMLGAVHKRRPRHAHGRIWQARYTYGAHAYLLNGPTRIAQALDYLAAYDPHRTDRITDWDNGMNALWTDHGLTYAPAPQLAAQRGDHSDIAGHVSRRSRLQYSPAGPMTRDQWQEST